MAAEGEATDEAENTENTTYHKYYTRAFALEDAPR